MCLGIVQILNRYIQSEVIHHFIIFQVLWTAVSAGSKPCPNDCSGMGTCDPTTGTCSCNEGCYGDDCSVVCPNDCSGMGTCTLPGNSAPILVCKDI